MASKTLLLLGLMLAIVFLISSKVEARELTEETKTAKTGVKGTEAVKKATGVAEGKQYGGYPGRGSGGYPGSGHGGYPGRGYHGGYPGGRGYGGRHCYWGCCGRSYYGGCRCCSSPSEIPEAGLKAQTHN